MGPALGRHTAGEVVQEGIDVLVDGAVIGPVRVQAAPKCQGMQCAIGSVLPALQMTLAGCPPCDLDTPL